MIGLDGVVCKRADLAVKPGSREGVGKVKHHKTCDCVIVGYRKNGSRVASLLLGLYGDDGTLDFVGHTSGITGTLQKDLQQRLPPLVESGHLGEGGRIPGGQSRWSQGNDPEWVEVRPEVVCEVRYDKMESDCFRPGTRFLRFRPDKDPKQCTWDQVRPARRDRDPTIPGLLAAPGSLPRRLGGQPDRGYPPSRDRESRYPRPRHGPPPHDPPHPPPRTPPPT